MMMMMMMIIVLPADSPSELGIWTRAHKCHRIYRQVITPTISTTPSSSIFITTSTSSRS